MRRASTFAVITFCAFGLSAGAMEAAGAAAPAGKLELAPCKIPGLRTTTASRDVDGIQIP